ncbi:MAG: lysophospholipid acyltransferase family protein [Burkholderiaceae bacterium]|nr:lysophospholipid acyltransferase family protein [Burkholderiaceae bacterium]MCD8517926.1 lysophospholipid acyltransferase family protein [Burkholderiaceae bacterium]MCD8536544.1 lysophospholipid acyltransferase family protein [Burkholderiaceae bacterium]MCD8565335.1 lysophospholipid acyltransferase family protein [Burkholderiaceae bacterium]
MLLILFRLLSLLPLSALQSLGRAGGRFVFALPGRYRERLIANARQAGFDDPRFFKEAAAQTGAMIMELPRVWFRSQESLNQVIDEQEPIVLQAIETGRPILYLTPHLGSFEMSARHRSKNRPMTVMFRPPRKAFLEPLMQAARNSAGVTAVPANRQGVREFLKTLKRGQAVGMLPDQVPREGEGIWAPFFGREAFTVTLPGKLAKMTNAIVIVAACERLPKGQGWRMHYLRAPDVLPDDARAQASLFNEMMQTLIHRFPTQYLWGYHRYKRPKDAPPPPDHDHLD